MVGGGLPDEPLCPCTVPVIVVPSTVALPGEVPVGGLKVTLGRVPPADARPVFPAPSAPRPPAGGRMRLSPPPRPTPPPPPPPSWPPPPPPAARVAPDKARTKQEVPMMRSLRMNRLRPRVDDRC